MRKLFIAILLIAFTTSCTDEDSAEKVLRDAGYHPIEVGGYGFLKCGNGDQYATKFKAYNNDKTRIVTGVICQGVLKGKTIRLD
jgi:hypothetical protein